VNSKAKCLSGSISDAVWNEMVQFQEKNWEFQNLTSLQNGDTRSLDIFAAGDYSRFKVLTLANIPVTYLRDRLADLHQLETFRVSSKGTTSDDIIINNVNTLKKLEVLQGISDKLVQVLAGANCLQ
jgi:hypothetical protein